jgi:hypothetical protein
MQRIDVGTAVAVLPTPAAAGTPGFFTEGDPVGGIAPTIVSGDWLNMVQEELIGVVVKSGLTPSKTNRTQLLTSIIALIVGADGSNIGSEGSISLAGGLLVAKWGTVTIAPSQSATTSVAHPYPVPFPAESFGVLGTPKAATAAGGWNPITSFVPLSDKNGFTVVIDSTDPGHFVLQPVPYFYIALGR